MAEEHVEETGAEQEESNGNGNGHSNGVQIGRMAAIAAASGATAYAAKKALESRTSSSEGGEGEGAPRKSKSSKSKTGKSAQTSASLVGAAVSSGWDVAKDSLMPIIEDAATKAGTYAADRSPEVVRDVVIPRFISGFEKARRDERGGDDSDE